MTKTFCKQILKSKSENFGWALHLDSGRQILCTTGGCWKLHTIFYSVSQKLRSGVKKLRTRASWLAPEIFLLHLLSTIIYYYLLLSTTISYYLLLSTSIYYYLLFSTTIYKYLLLYYLLYLYLFALVSAQPSVDQAQVVLPQVADPDDNCVIMPPWFQTIMSKCHPVSSVFFMKWVLHFLKTSELYKSYSIPPCCQEWLPSVRFVKSNSNGCYINWDYSRLASLAIDKK